MLSHLVCSCLKINLFGLTDESNQVSLLLINLISYKWQKMTIAPWYPIFLFSSVISFLSVSWANGFPVKDSISQTPLQWGAALWLSSSQWEVGGREMWPILDVLWKNGCVCLFLISYFLLLPCVPRTGEPRSAMKTGAWSHNIEEGQVPDTISPEIA